MCVHAIEMNMLCENKGIASSALKNNSLSLTKSSMYVQNFISFSNKYGNKQNTTCTAID